MVQETAQYQADPMARQSPDLNPMENVLAWMKLLLRETSCTNMKEWKNKLVKLWVTRMRTVTT
jgi:transposase